MNFAEFKRLDLVLEQEFLTLFRSFRRVGLQLSIVCFRRCAVGKGKSMSVCVAWGTHSEMDSHEVDGLSARRAHVVTEELAYMGVVFSPRPGVAPWLADMVACRPEVGA